MCSVSTNSSTYAFMKYSSGVILPVVKALNVYLTKSIMGAVIYFKCLPPRYMTCLENFKFNPNDINGYLPNFILNLPLADSSKLNYYITIFALLNSVKEESILNFKLVVILTTCMCHFITSYFLVLSFVVSYWLQTTLYTWLLVNITK